jgi:hypothetical protein
MCNSRDNKNNLRNVDITINNEQLVKAWQLQKSEDTDAASNIEISVTNVTAQDANCSVHPRLNFRSM